VSGRVPLPLLAIYEHAVIGMRCYLLFTFFLSHNRGGSASSAALLTAALLLLLTEIYFGFIQVHRPHLPHGHALRQGALGEALPRPLLAHLVAPTALFSQHVWHMMFGYVLCVNERIFFLKRFQKKSTTNEPTNQRNNEPTNQRTNEPTNQRTNEPTNQRTNETTKQTKKN